MTLTGHTGSLVFTNGTSVSGTVVLHHGSIKDGNKRRIRGCRYGSARKSPAMPFDCEALLAVLRDAENVRKIISSRTDAVVRSVVIHWRMILFMKDTLFVNGNCTMSGAVLENERIIASGDVSLGHNALFRNCTIIGSISLSEESARSEYSLVCSALPVTIKGAVTNSQFFSGDSIAVENTPTFGDMTVMFSHRTAKGDSAWSGGIVFKEKQHIAVRISALPIQPKRYPHSGEPSRSFFLPDRRCMDLLSPMAP
ncbi:MAG: hypothetical protein U5L04_05785 [Trueperaceae bacterium]|nr:hypothetical protein [Trueperaceae bacterium]